MKTMTYCNHDSRRHGQTRTEYLPNTSPDRYCCANPFWYPRCDICSCYLKSLRKHTAISGLNDAACWLFSSLLSCLDLINWILYVSPHTWILPACNIMPHPILISDPRGGNQPRDVGRYCMFLSGKLNIGLVMMEIVDWLFLRVELLLLFIVFLLQVSPRGRSRLLLIV